jgi:hypothetical protein
LAEESRSSLTSFSNFATSASSSANASVCSTHSVGDSHEGPLNNQGKPAYVRKKQTQMSLKHAQNKPTGPRPTRQSA